MSGERQGLDRKSGTCATFSVQEQCSQIKESSTENHKDFENFAEFSQINFENFVVLPLKNFEERK